ncbi:MAG: hypothetical protein KDD63_06680 [Bacteroidetes bacterium]|nr:hypothetical protein [Bacteroidota bacterium]MCB0851884.1 hypothetical protein [Bacteroidota bacterium]
MEELVKKFIYTGVGIASITAEKVQEAVDELIGKGKVSKEEGEKMVDNFFDQVDDRKHEIEDKVKDIFGNLRESLNLPEFVSKGELEAIVKRIEALEAKVGVAKTEAVATEAVEETKEVVKKSTAKAKKTTDKE